MSADEYNGWTNRETWAVALHINNDQGLQEGVHDALRARIADDPTPDDEVVGMTAYRAGEVVQGYVEELFDWEQYDQGESPTRGFGQRYCMPAALLGMREEIGSLWRVDWAEIGAAFLTDLAEQDS